MTVARPRLRREPVLLIVVALALVGCDPRAWETQTVKVPVLISWIGSLSAIIVSLSVVWGRLGKLRKLIAGFIGDVSANTTTQILTHINVALSRVENLSHQINVATQATHYESKIHTSEYGILTKSIDVLSNRIMLSQFADSEAEPIAKLTARVAELTDALITERAQRVDANGALAKQEATLHDTTTEIRILRSRIESACEIARELQAHAETYVSGMERNWWFNQSDETTKQQHRIAIQHAKGIEQLLTKWADYLVVGATVDAAGNVVSLLSYRDFGTKCSASPIPMTRDQILTEMRNGIEFAAVEETPDGKLMRPHQLTTETIRDKCYFRSSLVSSETVNQAPEKDYIRPLNAVAAVE